MKSQRPLSHSFIMTVILLAGLTTPLTAEEKQWLVLHTDITEEAPRIVLKMHYSQSNSIFYDMSRQRIESEDIEGAREEDYRRQFNLGTIADGNQYVVMFKQPKEIRFISQDSERICLAKVLRFREDGKTEDTLAEGLMTLQQGVKIPLQISPKELHLPYNKPLKGTLDMTIYGSNFPNYEARYQVTVGGTLSGTTSIDNALLEASLICNGSIEQTDWSVTLNVKPSDDRMAPASFRGTLTETLVLGSAKLLVEKIAEDSSELVLALIGGEMLQEKIMEETTAVVGEPFPPFARVDLVRRQHYTMDNLRKEAGPDGYVVLIFGDFKIQMSMQQSYGGMPPMRLLSLDDKFITRILKNDCDKPIVIGFICQRLSIADLYGKWLGEDPDYYVLSDYSDPLNILFAGPTMEPHMVHQQMQRRGVETLRSQLKVNNENVITALIDGHGDLVYWNDNAGNELSASLVQINQLMQQGVQADAGK